MARDSMRNEDSGLIDLDALLGTGEPTPSPASTASTSTPPATPAPARAAKAPPPAASVSKLATRETADDSLKAVAGDARGDLLSDPPPSSVAAAKVPESDAPASRAPIARPASKKRSGRALVVAAVALGLVGVAGGVALLGRRAPVTVETKTATASPMQTTKPVETAKVAPPETAEPKEEAPPSVIANAAKAADSKTATRVAAPARTSVKEEAPPAAKLETNDLAATGKTDPGDLGLAMRDAVGARKGEGTATAVTESNSNARQVRPSPGAVVGAIGAVMPSARACLEEGESVRTGEIVFKNDGSVVRVDLRGGQASDACIKAALSKAKIEPFVDDTFTARVTVRP